VSLFATAALSVVSGTIARVPRDSTVDKASLVLDSHTDVPLPRSTTFRFTLDPNREQHQALLAHAGAARLVYNHHLGWVKAQPRAACRQTLLRGGRDGPHTTVVVVEGVIHQPLERLERWPRLRCQRQSRRGRQRGPRAAVAKRGVRGRVRVHVGQRGAGARELIGVPQGPAGRQGGKTAGFPRFKSRHKSPPAFRLRSKSQPGQTSPVRAAGPRGLRFPKLGVLRAHEHTGKLATMLGSGRFHVYAASFRFERGRWVVAITGVAAQLHHLRRGPKNRYRTRVGVDLGVKTLAVVADEQGRVLHTWAGVKALQSAQARPKLANQSYSRTKRDSGGRKKAVRRLGKIHARVAALRDNCSTTSPLSWRAGSCPSR
jgi:putative transposase